MSEWLQLYKCSHNKSRHNASLPWRSWLLWVYLFARTFIFMVFAFLILHLDFNFTISSRTVIKAIIITLFIMVLFSQFWGTCISEISQNKNTAKLNEFTIYQDSPESIWLHIHIPHEESFNSNTNMLYLRGREF